MFTVYVCQSMPDEILAPLRELADVGVWPEPGPVERETLLREAARCEGLLSMLNVPIDRALLESSPRLKVVSQMAVGVDNIDVPACSDRGILIGHTPDVLTETVADTAFALLAAVVRRIPEGERHVREGKWGPWNPWSMLGQDLHGATLGIIGMGRIGQALARRATGFDIRLIYDSPRDMSVAGATRVSLEALLADADFVVVAASLKPDTEHLIGGSEFAAMKPTSYLVNVSRGRLVDTAALVTALESHSIAGAALDVTDPEPLPPDHELLRFDNCLVVPHIGSASLRARKAMASLAVDNLIAGLLDQPMPARYKGGNGLG